MWTFYMNEVIKENIVWAFTVTLVFICAHVHWTRPEPVNQHTCPPPHTDLRKRFGVNQDWVSACINISTHVPPPILTWERDSVLIKTGFQHVSLLSPQPSIQINTPDCFSNSYRHCFEAWMSLRHVLEQKQWVVVQAVGESSRLINGFKHMQVNLQQLQ